MTDQTQAIIQECKTQSSSCLYTSTSLLIWLRKARIINSWLNGAPILLGAAASYSAFQAYPYVTAIFGFMAGVLPSIYEKLELKKHTKEIEEQAGKYKNLQDRFRQTAEIWALDGDQKTLRNEFDTLMRQLEDLRALPITAPEKYFLEAQRKIRKGDYTPD